MTSASPAIPPTNPPAIAAVCLVELAIAVGLLLEVIAGEPVAVTDSDVVGVVELSEEISREVDVIDRVDAIDVLDVVDAINGLDVVDSTARNDGVTPRV